MNIAARTDVPFVAPTRTDVLARLEAIVCNTSLVAMVVLPLADLAARGVFRVGVPGAVELTQHLSLWVGFCGAVVAARHGRHLCLGTDRPGARWFTSTVTACVALGLAVASWRFLATEFASPLRIGSWLPVPIAAAVLPIAFVAIAAHVIARAGRPRTRLVSIAATVALLFAFHSLHGIAAPLVVLLVATLVIGALLGLPIFAMLGGIALVLFVADDTPIAAIPVESYRLVVSPSIPAIPLFTLTGFVLASGRAPERLVRLFRALFGALPGGVVIAATLVCAFFSAFTGASGVTILALGGLLLPTLRAAGASERFSVGLITSTGSIGLLFPPSLAVILFGVVAQVPINDLFRAGALPGLVMVAAISVYGVLHARRGGATTVAFDVVEAKRALWDSRYELALPIVVLGALLSGLATLIEAAAISACYAIVVSVVVHRDLTMRGDMPRVLLRCATLLGGVFAIIGVAMGLTNYLVDAMVPMKLVAWVGDHVHSRVAFMLMLNALLLIVGCVMDVFSAIFVVLPLIVPASQLFHVDPLHLAMIFLLNLEIGYLTPPVGMNLFLASYRLEKPVLEICRSVWPFVLVLGAVLLLITFCPTLILGAADR
jgi:C4-dicarboxylate transporter DctM subunit